MLTVFDLSKSSGGFERRKQQRRVGRPWEGCLLPHQGRGLGAMPRIFHFKIVYSGAFSYTNSKVLFFIKCRERHVIID